MDLTSGKRFAGDTPQRLADCGWCWEGQGYTGAGRFSIFGVGEGAKFFGLRRVFHLWHDNNHQVMKKLSPFESVVCEISPTRPLRGGKHCFQAYYDARPERFLEEAENVSRLSLSYPNLVGGYLDDTVRPGHPRITKELYLSIHCSLKAKNADLQLWQLVFSRQLYEQDFSHFKPYMDVINLWVWNAEDLSRLDQHVDRCQEIFPGKPVVLGCFLWDFPSMKYSKGKFVKGHAVPMDLLRHQWERLPRYLETGRIKGYSILAAYLIDVAQEQAQWVRDFIAAN
jgi:hypothetical protein